MWASGQGNEGHGQVIRLSDLLESSEEHLEWQEGELRPHFGLTHWDHTNELDLGVWKWWCRNRQLLIGKSCKQLNHCCSPSGVKKLPYEGPHSHKYLAHMQQKVCLYIARIWKVPWRKYDSFLVTELQEKNHLTGQSEKIGPAFLGNLRNYHGTVAHQVHYSGLQARQKPANYKKHRLYLQQIYVLDTSTLVPWPSQRSLACSTTGEAHQGMWWRMARTTKIQWDQRPVSSSSQHAPNTQVPNRICCSW